jgi:CheY-like chemotaxis protein
VLVDLNLPDMSGQELMRKIRSDHALGRLKVLAMSGAYRKADCEADALASGADAFLNKSFKPEELQQRIRDLLGL